MELTGAHDQIEKDSELSAYYSLGRGSCRTKKLFDAAPHLDARIQNQKNNKKDSKVTVSPR